MNPMVARKVHAAALALKEELDIPVDKLAAEAAAKLAPDDSEPAAGRVLEARAASE